MAHVPRSALAKNFHLAPGVFESIRGKERYIFAGSKASDDLEKDKPEREDIRWSKHQFTHKMAQEPMRTLAGEVRITDTSNFSLSKTVSAAHVTTKPGGIREMHWHPNADEWSFFIRGQAESSQTVKLELAETVNVLTKVLLTEAFYSSERDKAAHSRT
ncbi:hypothetical protein F5Y06DRAFT_300021 [Hypoxylon sp. FL0890]|nr:hypothetical protein F5Y06DRAFT_300021 [Hypoxylon sp. FL0890]